MLLVEPFDYPIILRYLDRLCSGPHHDVDPRKAVGGRFDSNVMTLLRQSIKSGLLFEELENERTVKFTAKYRGPHVYV